MVRAHASPTHARLNATGDLYLCCRGARAHDGAHNCSSSSFMHAAGTKSISLLRHPACSQCPVAFRPEEVEMGKVDAQSRLEVERWDKPVRQGQ